MSQRWTVHFSGGGKTIQVTLPRCPTLTYNHTINANLLASGTSLDFMSPVCPALLRQVLKSQERYILDDHQRGHRR